jgi:hypothetical protein
LLTTWWKKEGDVPFGRFGAAVQWPPRPRTPWIGVVGGLPPPLCFTYKYRGGGSWERGSKKEKKEKKKRGTKDERDERTQERKKEKKGKKMKEKNRWGRRRRRRSPAGHRDNNTAVAGSTASTPPQVTSCCPVLFPLAQPLPAFACRTWIIHVLQQMVRELVTVFVHGNQPIWCWAGWARSGPAHGPGPARFKKIKNN